MDYRVNEADFIRGSSHYEELPYLELPEIAFVGRSNAGKSTLINRLTNRKSLARTSSTPGRTQEINLFQVSVSYAKAKKRPFILADLPGFGFSKFAKSKREVLGELTVHYLAERENLAAVCLLNDSRRDPGRDDFAVRDFTFNAGRPVIIVVTKADKLSKRELEKNLKSLSKAYGLEVPDLIVTGEKMSVSPLWSRIYTVLP